MLLANVLLKKFPKKSMLPSAVSFLTKLYKKKEPPQATILEAPLLPQSPGQPMHSTIKYMTKTFRLAGKWLFILCVTEVRPNGSKNFEGKMSCSYKERLFEGLDLEMPRSSEPIRIEIGHLSTLVSCDQ